MCVLDVIKNIISKTSFVAESQLTRLEQFE